MSDDSAATVRLQTPPGRGGIAVLHLAGPGAHSVLTTVFRPLRPAAGRASNADRNGRPGGVTPPADVLQLGRLMDGEEVLDEAIVRTDPGGAEINVHGGPVVVRRVLEALAARGVEVLPAPGAAPECFCPAHPDRDNPAIGRELLAALPRARSRLVVSALSCQWSAGISRLARDRLAGGDAPDPAALRLAADGLSMMRRLLDPAEVVLAGPPNVGKSALANALVGREVSIVHDRPGTTRDWVRQEALLFGVPVRLTDTAGIWQAPDGVDAEAVRRARDRAQRADLVLLLGSPGGCETPAWLRPRRLLRLAGKADLGPPRWPADLTVSARTGAGLDELRTRILTELKLADFDPRLPRAFTTRQAELLSAAADAAERGDTPTVHRTFERLLAGELGGPAARTDGP